MISAFGFEPLAGKSRSIIDTLSKVHVNHAMLREAELVVIGNVNIAALFSKMAAERIEDWDEAPESDSEVTPTNKRANNSNSNQKLVLKIKTENYISYDISLISPQSRRIILI